MAAIKEAELQLALRSSTTSFHELLQSQKNVFSCQIEQLENIVINQCKLTGVNPLSQEMAAGALSIKIGKRPRDLLNPKAVKYMQELFSIKDAINKKEIREISALFGVTATQVREFFASQKSRVRKFVRLSREKANKSSLSNKLEDGVSLNSDPNDPGPVPISTVNPVSMEEGPTSSPQEEILPGLDEADKYFFKNILNLMRKEDTFSGQVKLMDWVLRVQNPTILYWFLTKGGVMILATWLSEAALEEQTSVIDIVLKVLCHLPLQKAEPVHMSAILQSVNKLRFYRASGISNKARILLAKWSKIFARSQALKKSNGIKSANDVQDEMLLKQSIDEVMGNETWDLKGGLQEGTLALTSGTSDNSRKLESPQPFKLLTASPDDSTKKLVRGQRERRKVQLVEHPGQKMTGRSAQVTKFNKSAQARPLSADDIQKAKMRTHFLQSKHGKSSSSPNDTPQLLPESSHKCTSSGVSMQTSPLPKAKEQKEILDPNKSDSFPSSIDDKQEVSKLDMEEPPLKKRKRIEVPWKPPREVQILASWKVGSGENSKEVEIQKNRIRRERQVIYKTAQEIPSNPREPWDREMDYDDSLTPEIPTEQLPDDGAEAEVLHEAEETAIPLASTSALDGGVGPPEPDLELLAVLLKNPQLVFALTSGQAGNFSSEETVKLLDLIKTNGLTLGNPSGLGQQSEKAEVSLPSPTPSSDPVTTGCKNPFSQQNMKANGGRFDVMQSQTATTSPTIMASQQLAQQMQVPQVQMIQPSMISSLHRANNTFITSSSNKKLSGSELLNMKNVSASNIALSNEMRGAQLGRQQTPPIMPAPISNDVMSASRVLERPCSSTLRQNIATPPRPQGQLQSSPYVPEAPHSSSWRERQGLNAASYYQGNHGNVNRHTHYAENDGRSTSAFRHTEGWNQAMERPGYESWSPNNSPDRSQEYFPQRDYNGGRPNLSQSYRPDRSMLRNVGYPPGGGYGDPSRGGGSRRWNDRRR